MHHETQDKDNNNSNVCLPLSGRRKQKVAKDRAGMSKVSSSNTSHSAVLTQSLVLWRSPQWPLGRVCTIKAQS